MTRSYNRDFILTCSAAVLCGLRIAATATRLAHTEQKNPVAADEKSVATGRALYTDNCVTCHGSDGKGDGPKAVDLDPRPTDLTSSEIVQESDGKLFRAISSGRRPMPAFRKLLNEEQRWHLVNYLRTLARNAAT